jgi:hypothetical protein
LRKNNTLTFRLSAETVFLHALTNFYKFLVEQLNF